MLSPYLANGELKPLPMGLQVFEGIISTGVNYIDKTEYIYRMTRPSNKFVFLSRPRRFGKSMLCYTLRAYFEGKRELFRDLAIDKLETEWQSHPVILLSMNICKYPTKAEVMSSLNSLMSSAEEKLGKPSDNTLNAGDRLRKLIEFAHRTSGKPVVLIIDEYDAPLLEVLHDEARLSEIRELMRSFYGAIKPVEDCLRFVFLTGITKFAQLSIFSTFNNINNISMDEDYAAVCGITIAEIEEQLKPYVERLAARLEIGYQQALDELKHMYDGYKFTLPSADIYNPYSLMLALSKRKIESYWFESGTPTFLIEMIKKFGALPTDIAEVQASKAEFDRSTDTMESLTALMYQSGYLTIKDYSRVLDEYTLVLPNKEVRQGLMYNLARAFVPAQPMPMNRCMREIRRSLFNDDMDGALRLIRDFFLTIPYADVPNQEGHYQQMLYIIFSLMGAYADMEVRTATGRIDVVMATWHRLYIIELKLNRSAEAAMRQIDIKDYGSRFTGCGKPLCRVGINFSTEERTLTSWTIE